MPALPSLGRSLGILGSRLGLQTSGRMALKRGGLIGLAAGLSGLAAYSDEYRRKYTGDETATSPGTGLMRAAAGAFGVSAGATLFRGPMMINTARNAALAGVGAAGAGLYGLSMDVGRDYGGVAAFTLGAGAVYASFGKNRLRGFTGFAAKAVGAAGLAEWALTPKGNELSAGRVLGVAAGAGAAAYAGRFAFGGARMLARNVTGYPSWGPAAKRALLGSPAQAAARAAARAPTPFAAPFTAAYARTRQISRLQTRGYNSFLAPSLGGAMVGAAAAISNQPFDIPMGLPEEQAAQYALYGNNAPVMPDMSTEGLPLAIHNRRSRRRM